MQFRCQAKAHLPFFFWYRARVYGEFAAWDNTTAALREGAARVPWDSRRAVALSVIDGSARCIVPKQSGDTLKPEFPRRR